MQTSITSNTTISYPIVFPAVCFVVVISSTIYVGIGSRNKGSFIAYTNSLANLDYIAIGY